MVFLHCPKCGEVMNSNEPVNLMGFLDFTIMPDGKIKMNGVWSSPKKESQNRMVSRKKKVSKFEGVKEEGRRDM